MNIVKLSSWSAFDEAARNFARRREELILTHERWRFEPLVYRGLANSKWGLETTLERVSPDEALAPITNMSSYYTRAYAARTKLKEMGKLVHLWEELPEPSCFDELLRGACPKPPLHFFNGAVWYLFFIYLRQYGFPSPLLDWTKSADYAAFFAFDSVDRNAECVSIYAMLRGFSSYEGPPPSIPDPYREVLGRHFIQEAQYSLCFNWKFPCEFATHSAAIEKTDSQSISELTRWDIPSQERIVALKALEQKNANAFALFCSDDSLIRTIARCELLLKE